MDVNEKVLPLRGVKIVELGTYIAVPVAARMLAEWGAEVIKVEDLKGEDCRYWGYSLKMKGDPEENPIFAHANMNKQTISIDLKTEAGRAVLKELLSTADAFISNVREQSLQKMGLDYDSLKVEFPDLIYLSFTGYGPKGPEAYRPGFDAAAFWARAGVIDTVEEGANPPQFSAAFADMICGLTICTGLMVALYGKRSLGRGTKIESSLLTNSLWCGFSNIFSVQYGNPVSRSDKYEAPNNPLALPYMTKDREWIYLVATNYNQGGFERTMRAFGMEHLLDDPRFNDIREAGKKENSRILTKIVREHFQQHTAEEIENVLNANNVVFERMRHYKDIPDDPQVIANEYLREVMFRNGVSIKMPVVPLRFSGYDEREWNIPGALACDTKQCLLEHGFSEEEIADLAEEKAIRIT